MTVHASMIYQMGSKRKMAKENHLHEIRTRGQQNVARRAFWCVPTVAGDGENGGGGSSDVGELLESHGFVLWQAKMVGKWRKKKKRRKGKKGFSCWK